MVQAKADVRPNELKSLLRTLARDTTRVELMQRRLAETDQTAETLRKQLRDQQRAAQLVERRLAVLEDTLRQITALEHGKRTDRRLARAQRLAQRGLAQAERVAAGGRTVRRAGPRAAVREVTAGRAAARQD
jgi:hypothetical protein